MKSIIAILAAIVCCSSVALAQGAVTVHVVDARSGKPVSGVPVAMYGPGGELDGITDRHGSAVFLTVPDGRTRVAASQETAPYYISTCVAAFTVASDQHRDVTLQVVKVTPRMGEYHPRHCVLSNLVQPGVGADVYDIY